MLLKTAFSLCIELLNNVIQLFFLLIHWLTDERVGDCPLFVTCYFRLFFCVADNVVFSLIWNQQTSSGQDVLAVVDAIQHGRIHETHSFSHRHTCCDCSVYCSHTGFYSTNTGILINFILFQRKTHTVHL